MRDYKKTILNKDPKHSRTKFINKDAIGDHEKNPSPSVDMNSTPDKGMTTRDLPGFVASSEGNNLIKDVFRARPNIVKALKEELGVTYVNQIPREHRALVAVRGIGGKSANHILEMLS